MEQHELLVNRWLEQCVLGLSLCPYAKAPWANNAVRVVVCQAATETGYLAAITREAEALLASCDRLADTSTVTETTLIAATDVLTDYLDFNDFISVVEDQLVQRGWDDRLQLADFHPGYQFAGEDPQDASNYTNRAPLPVIQLLRTETVSRAVDSGDTLSIPQRNIERLQQMPPEELGRLFPWVK